MKDLLIFCFYTFSFMKQSVPLDQKKETKKGHAFMLHEGEKKAYIVPLRITILLVLVFTHTK